MFTAITGILAAQKPSNTAPPQQKQYFTTAIYSVMIEDNLSQNKPEMLNGLSLQEANDHMQIELPTLESGDLTSTISYSDITLNPDFLNNTKPVLKSGTLLGAISYKQYSPDNSDLLICNNPAIVSGSISTAISYVNYNSTGSDPLTVATPIIKSGTLI